MKNTEFKTKQFKDATVYTLESATGGGTSAGAVASVSSPTGGVRRRGDNLIAQEANTDKIDASKPRNFVAKNAKTGGAGAHKDKKKAEKQGDVKHKNKDMDMAEGFPKDPNAPKLVQDRKTGKWYDPNKEFEKKMNSPEVMAQMKRMAQKEGVAEGALNEGKGLAGELAGFLKSNGFKGPYRLGKLPKWAADLSEFDKNSLIMVQGNDVEYDEFVLDAGFGELYMGGEGGITKMTEKAIMNNVAYMSKGVAEDSDPCWKDYKQLGMKKKGGKQVPNCVPKEGMAEDHEIQMASSELQSIAKNAESLLDMVRKYSEQDGLQAWQQSKITKAADYLNAVLQSVNGEQSDLNEGASDYVGNAIEDLRMSKPGLDRESFLDELYFYIDAQYGKQAADAAIAHENDAEFDDWYASYSDMAEDHSDMGQGFGKNGYRTAQAQKIQPNAGNVPVAEDEYMAELFNKLAEKIPANAPVDVWIKDFEKSNAPQFRGKNLAKRREMAVAASYGAKNPSKKKKK